MIYFFSILILLVILVIMIKILKKRKKPQSLSQLLDDTGFEWFDLDEEVNKYKHLTNNDINEEYYRLVKKKNLNEFEKTKLMAFKDLMQQRDLF